jgi:hypothetical protein
MEELALYFKGNYPKTYKKLNNLNDILRVKANDYTNMYKCQTNNLLVMNYELKFKVNEMKT